MFVCLCVCVCVFLREAKESCEREHGTNVHTRLGDTEKAVNEGMKSKYDEDKRCYLQISCRVARHALGVADLFL